MNNNIIKSFGIGLWRWVSCTTNMQISMDMRNLRSYPEDYSAKEALKIRKAHEDRLKYFKAKGDTDEVQNLLEDITPKKTKQRKGKRHKPEEDFGFAIEDLTLVQKAKRKRIQQKLKNKMILKKVRYQHYLARKPSKTKDIPIHPGSPAHQMGYRSNDEINILFPIPSVPRGPKLTAAQIAARRAQDRADRFKRLPKWLGQKEFKEIDEIYSLRNKLTKLTGEDHHVDHIIPLKGKNISGLHVPSNLQVMKAKDNISKSNRINLENIEILIREANDKTSNQRNFVNSGKEIL